MGYVCDMFSSLPLRLLQLWIMQRTLPDLDPDPDELLNPCALPGNKYSPLTEAARKPRKRKVTAVIFMLLAR